MERLSACCSLIRLVGLYMKTTFVHIDNMVHSSLPLRKLISATKG